MTALNGIQKRRTPNHQDHRTRKTPGDNRKRKTQRTEMLVPVSKKVVKYY